MSGSGGAHGHESFLRHLLRAAPVLLLVTAATYFLSHYGLLRGFETTALDVWLQVKKPQPVKDLVLVAIDDTDYRELFHKKSPLDPAVVQRIVDAIAAGGPRAVGVDLDTSDESWRAYTPPAAVPVVWAREGIPDETQHAEGGHGGPRTVFRAGPVLGRDVLFPEGVRSALALTPQDGDGVVRRYRHVLPVVAEDGTRAELPALGFGVVRAATSDDRKASHEALVLNFAGDRYAFPRIAARDVLAAASGEGWRSASPLKGKVVMLGGTYRAARDEYVTPVGAMPGVQIVAQSIESELQGGGIHDVEHWLMTLLEIASGVLLVWINFRFPLGRALLLSLVAIPVLTLVGSALVFSSLAFWFNFVPALVGVWIHELIDHAHEYKRMHEKLHALSKQQHDAHAPQHDVHTSDHAAAAAGGDEPKP